MPIRRRLRKAEAPAPRPAPRLLPLISRLFIVTKEAEVARLGDVLKPQQLDFIARCQRQLDTTGQIRMVVHKARQIGISTIIEAIAFAMCMAVDNFKSLIVSHEADSAEHILDMTRTYWDTFVFRDFYTPRFVTRTRLAWTNRSQIHIATAKNLGAGRSKTLQFLHASEVAFWLDASTLMTGLSKSVPAFGMNCIFLESTAFGVGNYFHNQVNKAMRGDSDYEFVFYPWYEDPDYTIDRLPATLKAKYQLLGELDEEEKVLRAVYGISDERLMWRRWNIANECEGDVEKFHQEMPTTPHEAFIATGRNVFSWPRLRAHYEAVPQARGKLLRLGGKIKFVADSQGWLRVFKWPDDDEDWGQYLVGADPTHAPGGDYACMQVINRRTMEQVAVYRRKIDPINFGKDMQLVGTYFNTAMLAPEKTGPGYACYSDDTELLTRRGWRCFDELVAGELVASRRDGEFVWEPCTGPVVYDFAGEMVAFKTATLDLLVTPNHRMLATALPVSLGGAQTGRGVRRGNVVITAGDWLLHGTVKTRIPSTATWVGERIDEVVLDEVIVAGDDFMALLGAWTAEGCTTTRHRTVITAFPGSRSYEEYRSMLERAGLHHRAGPRGFDIVDRRLHEMLAPLGRATAKHIPDWAKDAPADQLAIFWRYFWLGDGHRYDQGTVYTSSARLAGDLQEICQKMGGSASVKRRPRRTAHIRGRPVTATAASWLVHRRSGYDHKVRPAWQHYTGKVVCTSVPSGILYVRRNGKPAWCGNTVGCIVGDYYPNVYQSKRVDKMQGIPTTDLYGWATNVETKELAVAHLVKLLSEPVVEVGGEKYGLVLHDEATLIELRDYIKTEKGLGYGNADGTPYDDGVMALAIAAAVHAIEPKPGVYEEGPIPAPRVGLVLDPITGGTVNPMHHDRPVDGEAPAPLEMDVADPPWAVLEDAGWTPVNNQEEP